MSKKIIPISKIVLGACMVVLALIGYIPIPADLIEMTCISNLAGGIVLIVDGILYFKGKSVPIFLYRNIMISIFFVFLVCTGSLFGAYRMNFKGVFFLLHTIFPILFILMYIFFIRDDKEKLIVKITTTPVMMIAYLLFDFILGQIRGKFIYGMFKVEELSFWWALLAGVLIYLFLALVGWAFIYFNSVVHPNKDNIKNTK